MKTVLCHGVFDGLHAGHVRHLEAARKLGDTLVVSVTDDRYVGKGPGRPHFSASDRAEALRAVRAVDMVVVCDGPDATGVIRRFLPQVYCKGLEYQDRNHPEFDVAREHGAEVVFIGETLGSSSAALNGSAKLHPFLAQCREGYSADGVSRALEKIRQLRVNVIGDVISDHYIACKPLGLTSKGAALSVEVEDARGDWQLGGAAAIVAHIRALRSQVSHRYGTRAVEKTRWYMMAGDQVRVLFAEDRFGAQVQPIAVSPDRADLVIAADFGYGTVEPATLLDYSRVAVMCQSNSQNFGTNVLTRRYKRAGLFVVDDRELRLAAHRNTPTRESLLQIALELGAERAYWTRGQDSTISLVDGHFEECPALEDRPMDPLGAGDAFFTVAALCWAAGIEPDLSLLLAQIAGAQLTRVLGNEHALDRDALVRTAKAILA